MKCIETYNYLINVSFIEIKILFKIRFDVWRQKALEIHRLIDITNKEKYQLISFSAETAAN